MIQDAAHHFRAPGAIIVAFQWGPQHDLLLAIAPVLAVEHTPSVPPRAQLTYLRFRHIHNRAEVHAFLHYLAARSTPHNALHTRAYGQRMINNGTTQEQLELNQTRTDIAIVIKCDAAEATHGPTR